MASRLVVAVAAVWVLTVLYLLMRPSDSGIPTGLTRRLETALEQVKTLKDSNDRMREMIGKVSDEKLLALSNKVAILDKELDQAEKQLGDNDGSSKVIADLQAEISRLKRNADVKEPAPRQGGVAAVVPAGAAVAEREKRWQHVSMGVRELWMALSSKLDRLSKVMGSDRQVKVNEVKDELSHQIKTVMADVDKLGEVDQDARDATARRLQELMQRRLHHLQNPADCSSAKKLLCDVNKGCGYGCQLHHAVYCFMIAYGTQRTLILRSEGWRYNPSGWEAVFLPLSSSCTDKGGTSRVQWTGEAASASHQVVFVPIVDMISNRPPYMPLSFPQDLAEDLLSFHGDPSVWFIAQFVKYLTRPQPAQLEELNKTEQSLKFKGPIVGIHVRRTDKVGTEAAYHSIEEYMVHVEDYFQRQSVTSAVGQRRVYIASDDPSVLEDARKKYHDYEFIGDSNIAQTASLGSRYTSASLRGVLIDIHFLSKCDYLVCTFSSQVCRVAYEMMQTMHTDASSRFHSLDDIYYFGGQGAHEETAIYSHSKGKQGEIDIKPGDVVGIAGNHWDGYSKGVNKRTGAVGLYPSYKTLDKRVIVKYPTYDGV